MKLIEKYNVKSFENLFINKIIYNKLNFLYNDLENVIILGNSGSGKTSIINILKKKYKNNISLSNFNSKGYDFIMSSINNFIKLKSDEHKLIIFDNLDNISSKGQHVISEICNNTNIKLVISCSKLCNIIEPIQSNCLIIKLNLEKDLIFKNLKIICNKEGIKYDDDSLYFLIQTYNYDIRKIINIIDILNINFYYINKDNINKLLNKIDDKKIKEIIDNLLNKNIINCINISNNLIFNGYSIDDILLSLIEELKTYLKDNNLKINLINIVNKKYIIINEVINSKLQLFSCYADICNYLN